MLSYGLQCLVTDTVGVCLTLTRSRSVENNDHVVKYGIQLKENEKVIFTT